jgi:hypothetical protein
MRSRRWGLEGMMWSREIAIGEFCRLNLYQWRSISRRKITNLLVMTSRRSVRETMKTRIAPTRLAIYETINPSHTPKVYPQSTINVE